jgi:hypothetical protein
MSKTGICSALSEGPFGSLLKWDDSVKKNLMYFVDAASFPEVLHGVSRKKLVSTVSKAVRGAANDWEAVCDVHFKKVGTQESAKFQVCFDEEFCANIYLAHAFFPNQQKKDRVVRVGNQFLGSALTHGTRGGIMRHELGHVLGFAHEHDRLNPGVLVGWHGVTPHDAQSVMAYPQQVEGWSDRKISALDALGAAWVYGRNPLSPQCHNSF